MCTCDITAAVLLSPSVGSGHYTAYGSHEGRWYHFNDSTVTVSSEDTVRKAKAYILFYVERPAKAAAANTSPPPPPLPHTTATTTPDEVASSVGKVKEEDIGVSATAVAATSDAVTSTRGVPAGAAEMDEAVGGRLDGEPTGTAPASDREATDSDSRALPSNAAQ